MATVSTSWVQVNPSYMMPEIIMQYNQASGAFELVAGGNPQVRIGSEDLYVYVRRFDVRTAMSDGQSAFNQLPSVSVVADMISVPTYLQRVRGEYDHHDTAALANWGGSIVEAQRLGMRQGHFQLLRSKLLYGEQPTNGEGLLNAAGATTVSLPSDSNGNDTVITYDNGQMAVFLISQFSALKTRTMQLGTPRKFVICGPQRTLGAFEYQNIVSLVQFQRPGSGTSSTAGVVKEVASWNNDTVEWTYDDTLIGKGAGGTDAVIVTMPEVDKPNGGKFNTNEFAKLTPGLNATVLQMVDMAAPREIPTPLAGGAIDVLSEMRATPGWPVRPECVTIISMQYS